MATNPETRWFRKRRFSRLADGGAESAPSEPQQRYNPYAYATEEGSQRWSPSEMPRLLTRAVRLVYSAAPKLLLATLALAILSAVLTAVQVLISRNVVTSFLDVGRNHASALSAMTPVVLIAVVGAVSASLSVIATMLETVLAQQVTRTASREIIEVCTSVGLEAYEDPRFFDQLQRVLQNSLPRPIAVAQGLVGLVRGAAGAIGLVAVLISIAPLLVPVLLLVAVPLSLTGRRGSRLDFRFSVEQAPSVRQRYYLQEILTGWRGAKEVRAFGLGTELLRRWDELWSGYLTALQAQVRRKTRLSLAGRVGAAFFALLALFVLLELLAHHDISLPSAGAAGMALLLLSARVEGVANGSGGLYESGLFLRDLDSFLSLRERYAQETPSATAPAGFEGLTVSGLSFQYPSSDELALHGIDLEIRRGEIIALVGENGSGKTTLSKLLAGLYKPTAGRIMWDGNDIAQFDPATLRRSVAVIFQDFITYALPAAQNIGIGRPEAIDDIDGIVAAAEQSGADSFIRKLPLGYDNYLMSIFEGGRDLSLGQWQRVALARAFFRNAPLVILDEPSSALDPRSEADLFDRIRELLAGRTVLLISHRFSSVRSADRIYVMKEGAIAEHGTHEALMQENGLYAELYTLQARVYRT